MFKWNPGQTFVVSRPMRLGEVKADASYTIGIYRGDKLVSEHHIKDGKICPPADCQAGDLICLFPARLVD